jgi:putative sigma-54 modulation protein
MDIISVNVIATAQSKKGKDHLCVEYVINLAHKNSIVIKQSDDDLYAAIDLATARAQKAMRRMHDRDVSHHKVGLNETKAETVNVKDAGEAMEDEIVPVTLSLEPREVEDVLADLKETTKVFEIFVDNEGKSRVLYKKSNGSFGLY